MAKIIKTRSKGKLQYIFNMKKVHELEKAMGCKLTNLKDQIHTVNMLKVHIVIKVDPKLN